MTELSIRPALSPLEYDRLVLAINPVATRAAKVASAIEYNLRNGPLRKPVERMETVKGGLEANQEHFAKRLEPGDLVVTVTGDGGFRCVGAAALHPDLAPHRKDITFTTLGGGDACDLKNSLHGKHDRRNPSQ